MHIKSLSSWNARPSSVVNKMRISQVAQQFAVLNKNERMNYSALYEIGIFSFYVPINR